VKMMSTTRIIDLRKQEACKRHDYVEEGSSGDEEGRMEAHRIDPAPKSRKRCDLGAMK
jgi:hypothetical protein